MASKARRRTDSSNSSAARLAFNQLTPQISSCSNWMEVENIKYDHVHAHGYKILVCILYTHIYIYHTYLQDFNFAQPLSVPDSGGLLLSHLSRSDKEIKIDIDVEKSRQLEGPPKNPKKCFPTQFWDHSRLAEWSFPLTRAPENKWFETSVK